MARKKEFGQNWWAQKWLSVLELFGWDSRLQRGRTYARKGRVLDMQVKSGVLTARVAGSIQPPYKVTVKVKQLTAKEWQKVVSALGERAVFAAQLLSGTMPSNIEEAFDAVGVQLLPEDEQDIVMSCNCPDWANPCKHIAAVYYMLGQQFDQDPFLIFLLRGKSKDQLLKELASVRTKSFAASKENKLPEVVGTVKPGSEGGSLQGGAACQAGTALAGLKDFSEKNVLDCMKGFWEPQEENEGISIQISSPQIDGVLVKSQGVPPDWSDGEDFINAVVEIQSRISRLLAEGKLLAEKRK